jgi:hypothetical protein
VPALVYLQCSIVLALQYVAFAYGIIVGLRGVQYFVQASAAALARLSVTVLPFELIRHPQQYRSTRVFNPAMNSPLVPP